MPDGFYTIQEAAAKMGLSQDELLRTVSTSGIKKFQDQGQLVFKSEDIDKLAAGTTRRSAPGDSIFQSSSSGLFDVDDLMAELGTSAGAKQAVVPPPVGGGGGLIDEPTEIAARAPKKPESGAVMSDSGLFNVQELVQEAEIISNQKPLVPDDSTVIESPAKKKPQSGAVMSDSGLFDVQGMVAAGGSGGPAAQPAAKAPGSGAVMSDSGLFNVQNAVEQVTAPPPTSGVSQPSSGATGAVMSDSGLFDVRDLVGGSQAGSQAVDSPTKVMPGAPSYSRPAKFGAKGSGQSDSGLFSAAEVTDAAKTDPSTEDTTRNAQPVNPSSAAGQGITIFDPKEFDGGAGDAGAKASQSARDPRHGSGAGLKSPRAAREGTSLGGEVIGGLEEPNMQNPPRSLSSSAIFGAQRSSSPTTQTEIMDAQQPFRATSSGIFGTQGRGVSPNMNTEVMDAQPVEDQIPPATLSNSVAGSAAISPGSAAYSPGSAVMSPNSGSIVPTSSDELFSADDVRGGSEAPTTVGASGRPAARGRAVNEGSHGSMPSFSTMPTSAMAAVEPVDHLEPAFGFFLVMVVSFLVLGSVMAMMALLGIKAAFTQAFVESAKFVLIGGGAALIIGLIAGLVLARNK